ncbi:hypothetical protein GQ457_11G013150 [Hibiscus cannabinus]
MTHEGFAYNIVLDYTETKSSSGGTENLILARQQHVVGTPYGAQNVNYPSDVGALGFVKGLLGSQPKKVRPCRPNDFSYYKVEGVDHFMSQYNEGQGPIKESECGKKCSVDCKCLGYFYHRETSKCWVANECIPFYLK